MSLSEGLLLIAFFLHPSAYSLSDWCVRQQLSLNCPTWNTSFAVELLQIRAWPSLSQGVTGTRDWLACMPVDWGKLWEPAHIFLILPCFVLSRYHLISSLVFTVVSLIRVAAPCALVPPPSPSLLFLFFTIFFLNLFFLLVPIALPCDPNVLERSRKRSYYK